MSDLFVVSMVFGTRPEAIKMAPLAAKLRENSNIKLHICSTGQHREMLTQVLDAFDLQADEDLDVMTSGQTLNGLSQLLLQCGCPLYHCTFIGLSRCCHSSNLLFKYS